MVPLSGTMSTTMITLGIIGVCFLGRVSGIAKSFVNSSMPSMRPTFVVNFDMATVICQHSADSTDLHLHQMSILCDGKTDCFSNPAMHDESFPYCAGKCEPACTDRGACLHDGESAQCYCDSGFHGKKCEMLDNNECADKPCHWLAHCQNTFGSYYCSCFPGFEGNGYECTDIDECESGASNCPEHSLCVNLPGTYFCNCTEGFMPKGLPLERCADIDECNEGLHDCPDTHMCQNEVGSFRCVERCGPGHDLINGTCVDIDECARKDNDCDRRAICTNTPGSYRCECDAGFEGDGRVCKPIADCSQKEGICDMHAFCVASLRMCLCQAGYIGDGLSCYDVNECVTANNTCQGQAGTRCVNIDGGYLCCDKDVDDAKCMKDQGAVCANRCGLNAHCRNDSCKCVPGFEGDPLTKCTDINECETRDDTCKGVGQWCVNLIGGHICCGSDSTQSECQGLEISKGRLVTDKPPEEQPTTIATSPASTSAATSATTSAATSASTSSATMAATKTAAPLTPTDDKKTNLPVLVETSTAIVGSGTTITISSGAKETSSSGAGVSQSGGNLGEGTTTKPLPPDNQVTKQEIPDQSTVATTKATTSAQPSTEPTTSSTQPSTESITSALPSAEPTTSSSTSSTEQSTSAAVEVTTTTPSETQLTTTCGSDSTQSDCQGLEIVRGHTQRASNTTLGPTTISTETSSATPAPADSSATAAPVSSTESATSSTTLDITSSSTTAATSTEAISSTTSEAITSISAEATTSTTAKATTSTTTNAITTTTTEATTLTTTEAITSTEATSVSTESVTSTTTEATTSITTEATTSTASTTTEAITSTEATTVLTTEAVTSPLTEAVTSTSTEAVTSTSTEAVTSTSTEAVTSTSTEAVTSTSTEAVTSPSTEAVTSPSTEAFSSTTVEVITTTFSTTEAITSASSPSTTETSAVTTEGETKLPIVVESSTATVHQGSTAIALESVKTTAQETTTSSGGDVTTNSPETTTCGPDSTQSDCQGLEIVKVKKTSTQTITVAQTTTEATLAPTTRSTTVLNDVTSTKALETTTMAANTTTAEASPTSTEEITTTPASTTSTSTQPATTQEATTVSTTSSHEITQVPLAATSSDTPTALPDKLSPSPIPGNPTIEPSIPPVSFDTPRTAGPVTSETGVLKTTLQATEKPLTALPPTSSPEDKEMFNLTTTGFPSTTTPKSEKCRSSDDCGDDALCERRTGVCRCLPGFEGMPPTTPCQDVNECKDGLDDCDSSAKCLNFIGGYSCLCDTGYRKGEGGACFDINECDERTPCHKQAECRNLPGSYSCSCKPGFTGDGYFCIPLEKRPCNEKEAQKATCGHNHLCLVDGLEITDCNTCENGFDLVNGECIDINECIAAAGNYCHSNANCSNLMGAYVCACKPGFRGDGIVCQDIDECEANPCHPLAMCKNTMGSFDCQCPDGWSGDGKQSCLHPTDKECEHLESACGRLHNTACLTVNDGLGAICECELGYRYHNGTNQCNDIDECKEGRNGCNPTSSTCVNRMGEYSCECTDHFEGVGGVCVDVDECARQISKCDPNAHCVNEIGGYECTCAAGYTGNGQTCIPISGTDKGDECTKVWKDLCRQENKTCLLDDQGDAQCGACIEGHHPIQDRCEPVAGPGDCADPAKNDCHKDAECIDVKQGKHFCVCKVGYIGDGRRCDDVDECFIRSVCDERAVCRNTPGSFTCTCPPGFVGDGTQCKGPNCQSDSSLCHRHAECLLDGACRCLSGYEGDGTNSCIALSTSSTEIPTTTSTAAATTSSASTAVPTTVRKCSRVEGNFCHELAICQPDGTCKCNDGFQGDGLLSCLPVRAPDDQQQNCETKSDLCSVYATCQNRKCRCRIGYTGDGITCVSLETKVDCSKCHPEALCTEGVCACKAGYLGNGDTCIPDPNDCFVYPNLCHESATCIIETRRCDCNEGFVGDGTICAKKEQQSCLASPNLCHEDAKCLDGVCKCNEGFHGDGVSCNAAVESGSASATPVPTIITTGKACADGHSCHPHADCIDVEPIGVGHECRCKTGFYGNGTSCEDINECETSVGSVHCHHMAKCVNVVGSFSCFCPSGFTGDGVRSCIPSQLPDYIGVDCEADGMTLVLSDKTDPFNGRIFVREQSDNPFCSRRFNKINDTGPEYRFKVPFAHCNIRKESFDTFSVTVVVQKHPMFITEAADAYDLRCTYPTGTKDVMSHINVSMIATSKSFVVNGDQATCALTINDADSDAKMTEATVGQMLRLKLAVEPANLYSIVPRNCFAVNMESGDTYSLTDQAGCAVDTQLFPEWHRDIPSETYADFRTFKWPDSSHLRFQCDCSACAGECPKVNCARRRLALFRRRFRYRYIRSPTTSSPYHAFSHVLTVDDGEEERRAQRQLELWMASDNELWTASDSELAQVVPMNEEDVCLTAPWVGATVGLAGLCAIICAGITTILFCRRRTATEDDGTISSLSLF